MTITTQPLQVNIDNLNSYADSISNIPSYGSEIFSTLNEMDDLLLSSRGSTSSELQSLNAEIKIMHKKLCNLLSATETSLRNIADMFDDTDKGMASAMTGTSSGD